MAWDHRSASQDALGRDRNETIFDAEFPTHRMCLSSVHLIVSMLLVRKQFPVLT